LLQKTNIVSLTAYQPYVKVNCSEWNMLQGQGHWRRWHFHSQQHGELRT